MASTKSTSSDDKKSTAKKTTAKKVTAALSADKPAKKPAKTASPRKKAAGPTVITSEDRIKMIEVAAYYLAEKHGFGHDPQDYWLQAEQEVDAALNA